MQPESQELWLQRQAIELLAQHIPFETDFSVKSECIEELRALVLRAGHRIDGTLFGFEARHELQRLSLWRYFVDTSTQGTQDDETAYGHSHFWSDDDLDDYEGGNR